MHKRMYEKGLFVQGGAQYYYSPHASQGYSEKAIASFSSLAEKRRVGAQLRYFIYAGEQIVALTGFSAAAWQTAPRDQFIGWNHEQRKKNLHLITNNARFLMDKIEKPCIKNSLIISSISSG